jgi:hypothetical protein
MPVNLGGIDELIFFLPFAAALRYWHRFYTFSLLLYKPGYVAVKETV